MAGHTPPKPGVSAIGGGGNSENAVRAQVRGGRRMRRGDDPLKNPDAGRRVDNNSQLPPGVTARVPTDIREFDIAKRQRSQRNTKSYQSVDGQTYTFRTRDNKGNPLPSRMMQCLYLAIREQRLGGDPFVVFDAFNLKMEDLDGNVVYPVPDNVLAAIDHGNVDLFAPVDDEGEVVDDGFSIGE